MPTTRTPQARFRPIRDGSTSGRFAGLQARLLALLGTTPTPRPVADRLGALLGRAFPAANRAIVRLPSGARFAFPLRDRYWLRLLLGRDPYEPEIDRLLEAVASQVGLVVDGGANLGYWSASAAARGLRAVAVEASPQLWPGLAENQALAEPPFEVVRAAMWSRSGECLRFTASNSRHAAGALDQVSVPRRRLRRAVCSEVGTVTVDELIAARPATGAVLVKLDVEGAEVEALHGAVGTLARTDVIVVFEDHGNDPRHTVSRELAGRGLVLFRPVDDGWIPVGDLDELTVMKRDRRVGYNLVAVRPGGVAERLLTTAAEPASANGRSGSADRELIGQGCSTRRAGRPPSLRSG